MFGPVNVVGMIRIYYDRGRDQGILGVGLITRVCGDN